jgi:hypothetical protein
METTQTQLYDALGELIYALAKVDGLIDEAEIGKLEEVLRSHPWSSEIKWSFDYENRKANSVWMKLLPKRCKPVRILALLPNILL